MAHLPGMDTTADTIPDDAGPVRTSARAGSLTLTVWPDEPLGEHQRYAYRIHDATTGQTVSGRALFTGAGAPVEPGRAIRELAGFLSAAGEARQYALDNPGVTPENTALFPDDVAEAARVNLDALTLLAEEGPQPQETQERTGRRWVSVVFLQGAEADEVLDLLDRDGADAAIEHLAGYDDGDDTVQAALENGYVYDAPPTGMLDRTATRDVYTLVYSPFLGHLNLLREYDTVPDPALLGIDNPTPTTEAHSRGDARAPRQETADWFSGPTRSPHGGGLSL
ncbi:MAG: hypothetical protein ACYCU5_10220 [Actinomycetes bacterium]